MPDAATRQEIVGLVIKYLNENPEKLNNLALHLVSNAFIDAFDCNVDLKYPLRKPVPLFATAPAVSHSDEKETGLTNSTP